MPNKQQLAELAADVVQTVWLRLDPIFGTLLVDVDEFRDALNYAAADVRDLLDPAESFDVEIDDEQTVGLAGLADAYAEQFEEMAPAFDAVFRIAQQAASVDPVDVVKWGLPGKITEDL